jgi:signal transduction histidine kinase
MRFLLKSIILLIFFPSYSLFANKPIKNLRDEFYTRSDSNQYRIYIDLSKEYRNINLDSSLYFAQEALRISTKDTNNKQIIESLLEISDSYQDKNKLDDAKVCIDKAELLASKINDSISIANVHKQFGSYCLNSEQYDKALYHYKTALDLSISLLNKKNQLEALIGIGSVHWERNEQESALQNFLEAYHLSEKLNAPDLEVTILVNLGNIYGDEDQNDKAILFYQQALNLAQAREKKNQIASIYNNIAILYHQNKEYQKALIYYGKSLNINNEINDDKRIAMNLNNIGDAQFQMGNIKEATESLLKALAINRKINLNTEVIYNLQTLAEISLATENFTLANSYIQEGMCLSKKLKLRGKTKDLLLLLAKYYHRIENHTKAYSTLIEHNILQDSLQEESNSDKIAQLQTQFESEKKEKENEILRVKNQVTQKQLEQEQLRTTSLFIFSFLALAVIALIVILFRSKVRVNKHINEINKKLEESNQKLKHTNATKDKFFSIIAHDLRSPFNAILGLSGLLKDELESTKNMDVIRNYNNMVDESAHSLFSLLENLLQWAKSQQGRLEFSPTEFDFYTIMEANLKIFKSKTADKSVELNSLIEKNTIAYGDINMVDSTLRNLISNALKYTLKGGNILISSKIKNNQLYLSVRDNGIGIRKEDQKKLFQLDSNYSTTGTNSESGSGLGLILCKEFVHKNGGEIWVESKLGKGSEFIFTLPLPKSE